LETRIDLIRHGETLWNSENRFQGQLDSPLSPRGLQQAQALRQHYQKKSYDFIYSSDLGRAVDTAKAILGSDSNLNLNCDPALRERKFGVFEGLSRTEVQQRYPEEYRIWTEGAFDFKAEGGESRRELLERCKAKFEDIAKRHRGQYGLIVVHGGLLSTFWRHLEPSRGEDEGFKIPNASITELLYASDEWQVLNWSLIDHLHGIETLYDPNGS